MSEKMPKLPPDKLNEKEAHEEAAMMKSILRDEPTHDDYIMPRTAEEYDRALFVVEQIKRMAEEEPLTEKVFCEIARLTAKSGYVVLGFLAYLNERILTNKEFSDKENILRSLDDASKKLKDLKAGKRGIWTVE